MEKFRCSNCKYSSKKKDYFFCGLSLLILESEGDSIVSQKCFLNDYRDSNNEFEKKLLIERMNDFEENS